MSEVRFDGYIVENANRGVRPIEIRYDGRYYSAWIGGNLADDIPSENLEDFLAYLSDEYGNEFIFEMSDYRNADWTLSVANLRSLLGEGGPLE